MTKITILCRDCHRIPTWVLCGVFTRFPYVCGYHVKKYRAMEIQTAQFVGTPYIKEIR